MSKRRRGYPSETQVKRGVRLVHGDKLLEEKLGRNDLCPCGSGQRFKKCCLSRGCFDGVNRHDLFQKVDRNASHGANVPDGCSAFIVGPLRRTAEGHYGRRDLHWDSGVGEIHLLQERFFSTHVRISLDLLKTRFREQSFIYACLGTENWRSIHSLRQLLHQLADVILQSVEPRWPLGHVKLADRGASGVPLLQFDLSIRQLEQASGFEST